MMSREMELDPYRILNLPRDATPEQIRRQFRECVKANHPDQGAGPESVEMLRRVVQAYRVLTQRDANPEQPATAESRLSDLMLTAQTHLTDQAYEQAEILGRLVLKDNPGSAAAYIVLARALAGQGRPAEAIGCYTLALQLDPDNTDARVGLNDLKAARAESLEMS